MMIGAKTFVALTLFGLALANKTETSSEVKEGQGTIDLISTIFTILKDEVSTHGLTRIDAGIKSAFGSPSTAFLYAASLAAGALTMLAFYESPVSPIPVQRLPNAPVGRFPPEHSVWPPTIAKPSPINIGPQYSTINSNEQLTFSLPSSIEKIQNKDAYQPYGQKPKIQ